MMRPEDFTKWRDLMGLNRTQAADALGIGRNMPQRYEEAQVDIPISIELACEALTAKFKLDPDFVEVFSFLVYDAEKDVTVRPPSKRDAAFIQNIARGEIIKGTQQFVRKSDLDAYGRYYPEEGTTTVIVDKIERDLAKAEAALQEPAFLAKLGTSPRHLLKAAVQERLSQISSDLELDNVGTGDLNKFGQLTIHWHHVAGDPPRRTEVHVPQWIR